MALQGVIGQSCFLKLLQLATQPVILACSWTLAELWGWHTATISMMNLKVVLKDWFYSFDMSVRLPWPDCMYVA